MFIFHRPGRFAAIALVSAGLIFVFSACSASDDGEAGTASASTASSPADDQTSSTFAQDAETGMSEIGQGLDEAGLGSKAEGLLYAMKADRYEIIGDELHLYLGDKTSAPQGTECIIATSVLSAGETVVIHRDDTATPCE